MKISTYSRQFLLVLLLITGTSLVYGEIIIVEMKDSEYHPKVQTVKVGDTVKWLNVEKRQYHSVWFEAEGFPEPDYLFPEEYWERTFDKPGTYPYRCEPHPEMTGTIIVE